MTEKSKYSKNGSKKHNEIIDTKESPSTTNDNQDSTPALLDTSGNKLELEDQNGNSSDDLYSEETKGEEWVFKCKKCKNELIPCSISERYLVCLDCSKNSSELVKSCRLCGKLQKDHKTDCLNVIFYNS